MATPGKATTAVSGSSPSLTTSPCSGSSFRGNSFVFEVTCRPIGTVWSRLAETVSRSSGGRSLPSAIAAGIADCWCTAIASNAYLR